MISVLVSITALQQRLITLRGGRPHRRWMGWVAVGRKGGRGSGGTGTEIEAADRRCWMDVSVDDPR